MDETTSVCLFLFPCSCLSPPPSFPTPVLSLFLSLQSPLSLLCVCSPACPPASPERRAIACHSHACRQGHNAYGFRRQHATLHACHVIGQPRRGSESQNCKVACLPGHASSQCHCLGALGEECKRCVNGHSPLCPHITPPCLQEREWAAEASQMSLQEVSPQ